MKRGVAALLSVLLLADVPLAMAETVAEPTAYRMDNYKAPVPATLKGATVVNTDAARKLIEAKAVVLVDVMPHLPKPDKLPAGTIWRDKERKDIEGSIWLPNTGYGALSTETESYFEKALMAISGGSKIKPLLFYCMTDCWMSWNAARRALELGYTQVSWYPEGADGWEKAGNTLVTAQPYKVPQ